MSAGAEERKAAKGGDEGETNRRFREPGQAREPSMAGALFLLFTILETR